MQNDKAHTTGSPIPPFDPSRSVTIPSRTLSFKRFRFVAAVSTPRTPPLEGRAQTVS